MQANNPYTEILQMIRAHGSKYNPPSIQLAEVLAPPPNLIIKLGDIQVKKESIFIADYLLQYYRREYYANGDLKFSDPSCSGSTDKRSDGDSPHDHGVISITVETGDFKIKGEGGEYLYFTDTLKPGDLLAVMPTYDMQTYIVLAKVVRPDKYDERRSDIVW